MIAYRFSKFSLYAIVNPLLKSYNLSRYFKLLLGIGIDNWYFNLDNSVEF